MDFDKIEPKKASMMGSSGNSASVPGRSIMPPPFALTTDHDDKEEPVEEKFLCETIGKGATNNPDDLKKFGDYLKRAGVLPFLVAKLTDPSQNGYWIERYQKEVLGWKTTDGVAEPGGKTITAMLELQGKEIVASWFANETEDSNPEEVEIGLNYNEIAQGIFDAGQGWNTDEEKIYKGLERIQGSSEDANKLKDAFQEMHGIELEDYLKKELWDVMGLGEETKALNMLNGPDQANEKEEEKEEDQALQIPKQEGEILTKDLWETQITDKIQCINACKKILKNYNKKKKSGDSNWNDLAVGGRHNILKTASENHEKKTYNKSKSSGLATSYIDEQLEAGNPVMVGVSRTIMSKSEAYNEGTTDHFVMIGKKGKGTTTFDGKSISTPYYQFYEVGTAHEANGTSEENRLFYNPETEMWVGSTAYNTDYSYVLSQVRPYKKDFGRFGDEFDQNKKEYNEWQSSLKK